jgi:hypothetical protein
LHRDSVGLGFILRQSIYDEVDTTKIIRRDTRLMGQNLGPMRWKIPSRPSVHTANSPSWAVGLAGLLQAEGERPIHTLSTDGSDKPGLRTCAEQWDPAGPTRLVQGAIVADDSPSWWLRSGPYHYHRELPRLHEDL